MYYPYNEKVQTLISDKLHDHAVTCT